MKTYKEVLVKQQHKVSKKVDFNVGNLAMVKLHVPMASSNKLSPKFTGPHRIVDKVGGNKYKIQNVKTLEVTIRHADDLKKVNMEVNLTASQLDTENEETDAKPESDTEENDDIDDTDEIHEYTRKKLRSHTQRFIQSKSDELILTCNITEFFLESEFDDYVNTLLDELSVDINTFYR